MILCTPVARIVNVSALAALPSLSEEQNVFCQTIACVCLTQLVPRRNVLMGRARNRT